MFEAWYAERIVILACVLIRTSQSSIVIINSVLDSIELFSMLSDLILL